MWFLVPEERASGRHTTSTRKWILVAIQLGLAAPPVHNTKTFEGQLLDFQVIVTAKCWWTGWGLR